MPMLIATRSFSHEVRMTKYTLVIIYFILQILIDILKSYLSFFTNMQNAKKCLWSSNDYIPFA